MEKKYIKTEGAPRNVGINAGHFSQAVRVGNTVYIGGTLSIDPTSMQVVKGGGEHSERGIFSEKKGCSAVVQEEFSPKPYSKLNVSPK